MREWYDGRQSPENKGFLSVLAVNPFWVPKLDVVGLNSIARFSASVPPTALFGDSPSSVKPW